MKKMKKAFALLIAAVLVLSLSATAFAAGATGSIILKDAANVPVAGKTFNAYKILDASFTSEPNADKVPGEAGVAYTVPAEMADFYAKRYNLEVEKTAPDFGEKVAAKIAAEADMFKFAADALAAAKTAYNNTPTGTATAGEGVNSVTIGNLPFGYYVIEDAGAKTPISALMLQTVGGVEINIKADKPTIDKVIVNADSANGGKGNGTAQDVGSVVEFELTSKVPDMTGYKSYTYVVHDTMSDGLSFNKESVKVTIGGKEYTDFTVAEAGQSFTITFNNFIKQQAGAEIVVTYSAVLNEKALRTEVETNTVKLEYSNNPNYVPGGEPDDGGTEKTPEKKVYVYDFDIVIDKYTMQAEENVKLADAEFVLYKGEGEGKTYYKWNEDTKKVEWVKTIDEATKKTTDKNGYARFEGLDAGTYYLEETKAPAGYNKLAEPVKVVISATYKEDGTIANTSTAVDSNGQLSQTQSVENHSGTVLPETGGIGTTIFYIVGAVLAVGAIILLITKKRMANETK